MSGKPRVVSAGLEQLARLSPDEQTQTIAQAIAAYRQLPVDDPRRAALLAALAAAPVEAALAAAVELVCDDPPARSADVARAAAPLFQRTDLDPGHLFPRLTAALERPSTAPVVLDLANYLRHRGRTPRHPFADRVEQLSALLRQLVEGLHRLEEGAAAELSAERLREQVSESIALFISLAHALALIGDRRAAATLSQALAVGHRRLQAEAAVALARLGEAEGFDHLAHLASQVATRSRALAYLAELEALDRAAEADRTPLARAEGELAQWLSDPLHFGTAPSQITLAQSRTLSWPGFDQPIECFLLRFEYAFGKAIVSGVGLVGPLTLALPGAWDDLEHDDLFGYFAGWQAEHEEIRQWTAAELGDRWPEYAARLSERLTEAQVELTDVSLEVVGRFFAQEVLVASACRHGQSGLVVADDRSIRWWNARPSERRFGPQEAYHIYKGRAILATFNRPEPLE